jgi:hypothetical protein
LRPIRRETVEVIVKSNHLPFKAWAAAAAYAVTAGALAAPMTYTATLVTDVKVGRTTYTNAAVTVTFTGDSNNIQPVTDSHGNPIPSTFCTPPTTWFYYLPTGTTSVSVTSHGKTVVARLKDGQVFVAVDQCNGGIGFGSYVGPNGFEVAYPVSFVLGTAAMYAVTGSALSSTANMSGYAWSCIGYPPTGAGNLTGNGTCASPDQYPLLSVTGLPVVFYLPYTRLNDNGTICCNHYGTSNFGTFSVRPLVTKDNNG